MDKNIDRGEVDTMCIHVKNKRIFTKNISTIDFLLFKHITNNVLEAV